MSENSAMLCKRIIYSIIIGIFGVLTLLMVAAHLEKKNDVIIRYVPDGENDPELAWIDNIYMNGRRVLLEQGDGTIEYKENDNRYRWDGFREVELHLKAGATDWIEFNIGYREGESEMIPRNARFEIERNGKTYQLPLRTCFDYTRKFIEPGKRWLYWSLCLILFCILSGLSFLALGKIKYKMPEMLFVALWAMATRIYMNLWTAEFLVGGDTMTYVIDSWKELSLYHRMPVYQLLLYWIKVFGRCDSLDRLFKFTVLLQSALGIVACVLLYDALKKMLKREWIAFGAALVYAAQPYMIYHERNIMTESLAIDMMIGLVWLLACYLKRPTKPLAVILGIYSLLATLTRPSFLILFPIFALFWGIKLLLEKETRRYTVWGIGGFVLSVILLLFYCGNNKKLTGQFMLCDVSYNNQISIIAENGLYESESYPEIAELIRERNALGEDSIEMSNQIYTAYGHAKGAAFAKQVQREKPVEYLKALTTGWKKYRNKPLWRYEENYSHDMGEYFEAEFEGISMMLLPMTFQLLTILCFGIAFVDLYIWFRTKQIPWITLGLSALILATIILGFGTLTHAVPQRICCCIVPLTIALICVVAESCYDYWRELWTKKNV